MIAGSRTGYREMAAAQAAGLGRAIGVRAALGITTGVIAGVGVSPVVGVTSMPPRTVLGVTPGTGTIGATCDAPAPAPQQSAPKCRPAD